MAHKNEHSTIYIYFSILKAQLNRVTIYIEKSAPTFSLWFDEFSLFAKQ